jgi:chemotaxis signal transduction protein
VETLDNQAGAGGVEADLDVEAPGLLRYGYQLGEMRLLFDPSIGSQILDLMPVFPLPNSARWFTGLANVHGGLVPVFDLGATVGEPVTQFDDCKLLVLGERGHCAGILINSLPSKMLIDASQHAAPRSLPQPPIGPNVVSGYWHQGSMWMEVDYDALFRDLSESGSA